MKWRAGKRAMRFVPVLLVGTALFLLAVRRPTDAIEPGPQPAQSAATGEKAAQSTDQDYAALGQSYAREVQPLFERFCHECHSGDDPEGDIDFAALADFADARKHTRIWQKASEMLESGQMPPEEATNHPTDGERARLEGWVRDYLRAEGRAHAGDPGRVVLRRLSNAEYAYTIRDLVGVEMPDPTREFPVDGAAGEGFTNTGNALVMSPELLTKYLDAAKGIADHALLLPDGFRFSPHTTRRDWTDDILASIRAIYNKYSDPRGGDTVNLQGIVFQTNEGGRLALDQYLAATLTERESISSGATTIDEVARKHDLNAKYLGILWEHLTSSEPSLLLDPLRERWRTAKPDDATALAAEVSQWQRALWKFNSVGQIGKVGGPKAWMEPVSPLATRRGLQTPLPAPSKDGSIVVYLVAGDAGDGNENDVVVWEHPRLVAPGRPDLLLRDVRQVKHELAGRQERIFAQTAKCLQAAADAAQNERAEGADVAELARKYEVDAEALSAWLDFLGIGSGGSTQLGTPITRKFESASGYDFVKGWAGDGALSVAANSSDQHVRIPGNMNPHCVAVHPMPTLNVAVGWKCPEAATLRLEGAVTHAHPECGNGVTWSLELRRGQMRQRLAAGISQGGKPVPFGPLEGIVVRKGDVIALVIGPRDGNHSCDLTQIDLAFDDGTRKWSLAGDLSPDILAGSPHPDSRGNADVWHFFSEPVDQSSGYLIPAGSLLAKWQAAQSDDERQKLAEELQRLLVSGASTAGSGDPRRTELPKDSPDAVLCGQIAASFQGALLSAVLEKIAAAPLEDTDKENKDGASDSSFGLDPRLFGKLPDGSPIDAANLSVQAPSVLKVRLPADLVAGAQLVTAGTLHAESGREGSVQFQVETTDPGDARGLQPTAVTQTNNGGAWTSVQRGVSFATPVVTAEGSAARKRFEAAFDEFRNLFPAALCYTKIVPVDEVITLTLFYREDDHLARLMLDDEEKAQLDRLWDELHYVSRDALLLVDALAQLIEYATQDADPSLFTPLREPFADRAAAFRQRLVDTEPQQLESLLRFAGQAWRRPLSEAETNGLRSLYATLRSEEFSHDEAFRLTMARVLVAPAFLYKAERPGAGEKPGPVTDWELANRLSYFLWSSQPNEELRQLAASGRLGDEEVLVEQTRRMLRDDRARRLAIHFACQWLHVRDFDGLEEKSERHFPEFVELRDSMYEESIRFFTDLFQNDRSVLDILDADYTFLNEELAGFYGIDWASGSAVPADGIQNANTEQTADGTRSVPATVEWRRFDGVKQHGRGGILGQATTLASNSGASRTSPILRGIWISETLLGERLPRPPKDVPKLPEDEAATDGLTVRELVERHSSDPKCAVCHSRFDAFGFSLEGFDAIGRGREIDLGGRSIDTHVTAADGAKWEGIDGLRAFLLTTRREAFVRQFCRKLLGYSLGRAVQLSDEPLLEQMQIELKANDYRVSAAIEAIVRSKQFREIRGRDAAYEE